MVAVSPTPRLTRVARASGPPGAATPDGTPDRVACTYPGPGPRRRTHLQLLGLHVTSPVRTGV